MLHSWQVANIISLKIKLVGMKIDSSPYHTHLIINFIFEKIHGDIFVDRPFLIQLHETFSSVKATYNVDLGTTLFQTIITQRLRRRIKHAHLKWGRSNSISWFFNHPTTNSQSVLILMKFSFKPFFNWRIELLHICIIFGDSKSFIFRALDNES